MPNRSYVHESAVVLVGCRAWDNMPGAPGDCPVCRAGIRQGDDYACLKCGSVEPSKQARIDRILRAERIGAEHLSRWEIAENRARTLLRGVENGSKELSEIERRRMWNGYKGGVLRELVDELPNIAQTCRDWLRSKGWEPNWSLVLDRRGNVIDTLDPGLLP